MARKKTGDGAGSKETSSRKPASRPPKKRPPVDREAEIEAAIPDELLEGDQTDRREALCWAQAPWSELVVELAHDLRHEDEVVPAGRRGVVMPAPMLGRSAYDYHSVLPVEGRGLPVDALLVLERRADGSIKKTPYRAWCRALGFVVTCPRCGNDLVESADDWCPESPLRPRKIVLHEGSRGDDFGGPAGQTFVAWATFSRPLAQDEPVTAKAIEWAAMRGTSLASVTSRSSTRLEFEPLLLNETEELRALLEGAAVTVLKILR